MLTSKDRVLLLTALSNYKYQLQDRLEKRFIKEDSVLLDRYTKELEKVTELFNSDRLI
jgi:hypothetical protein